MVLKGILKEVEGFLTGKYEWKRGSKKFSSRQQQGFVKTSVRWTLWTNGHSKASRSHIFAPNLFLED